MVRFSINPLMLMLNLAFIEILSEDVAFKQFPKFEKDRKVHEREQITRKYNPGQSFLIGITVKIN